MAYDRGSVAAGKPFLMKHAEDAKIKDECEKDHDVEAIFKGVDHTTPSIEAAAPSMRHDSHEYAQALQAHSQSNKGSLGSQGAALKKFIQVTNMNPRHTVVHLRQIFSFCGTVVDCFITDSKNLAYIEYSKPEEATAALTYNHIFSFGRLLNVEIAKSLPRKPSSDHSSSSLPMMMPEAVAMSLQQLEMHRDK